MSGIVVAEMKHVTLVNEMEFESVVGQLQTSTNRILCVKDGATLYIFDPETIPPYIDLEDEGVDEHTGLPIFNFRSRSCESLYTFFLKTVSDWIRGGRAGPLSIPQVSHPPPEREKPHQEPIRSFQSPLNQFCVDKTDTSNIFVPAKVVLPSDPKRFNIATDDSPVDFSATVEDDELSGMLIKLNTDRVRTRRSNVEKTKSNVSLLD